MPSLIGRLLPRGICAAEAWGDLDPITSYPEETRAIGLAVGKRQREFVTGRECARRALAGLGIPRGPIPVMPDRSPSWPPQIVGSITHCHRYRAAAVGRRSEFLAVGIDAEADEPLPEELIKVVLRPDERAAIAVRGDALQAWAKIHFSAKESVYKALSAVTGSWLGFHDVRIETEPAGRLRATIAEGRAQQVLDSRETIGYWHRTKGLILTTFVIAG